MIDPRTAGDEEVVGIGDDLSAATLIWAYGHGIFPWPIPDIPFLPWFCPPERAVLDFDKLRVPSRLARLRRSSDLSFTIDQAFERVIATCQAIDRPGQDGTWITEEMRAAYTELHKLGYAHSVEAWSMTGDLVGGLYGVSVEGVFTGESMFHLTGNASKLALLHLVDHLRERGLDWIDIETMTPHFAALGATLISRDDFLGRLEATQRLGLQLWDS